MTSIYRWIIAHPKTTIAAVLVVTLAFGAFLPRIEVDPDFSNYLNKDDPAVRAADAARERYGSQILLMVVVRADDGIFTSETLRLLEEMGRAFERLSSVEEVTGPLNTQLIRGTETEVQIGAAAPGGRAPQSDREIDAYRARILGDRRALDYVVSADGTAGAFYLRARPGVEMIPFAREVDAALAAFDDRSVQVAVAGIPYMNLTLDRSMKRDLWILLPLVVVGIGAVLYVGFRSWLAVVLPFLIVGASAVWSLGLMAMTNTPITVLSFILPVVLAAIGIADSIHVLSRYREARRTGRATGPAILATMTEMTGPVMMTSLTTAVGFLSLLNSYLVPQRTFGVFTAAGILAAMLLSLVWIPAVLAVVGERWDGRGAVSRTRMADRLAAVTSWIARRRAVVGICAAVLVVVCALGLPSIRIETSQRAFLGADHPAVRSLELMDEYFSGGEQIIVEVDTGTRDGLKDPAVLREIADLQEFLASKGIAKALSIADIVREMNQRFHADDPAFYAVPDDRRLVSQLLLLFTFQGGNLGAMALGDFSAGEVIGFYASRPGEDRVALVREITAYLDERFGGRAQMVGPTRVQASMYASIARSQMTSVVTSIGAAGLIVVLLMGSITAGLISLIPLLFTIVINFGVMAYAGVRLDLATLMVSSITIGIGIDYGIHYLARFRREVRGGQSSADATVATARTAGRGIVYNVLALAIGFSVLILSTFHGMRSFGTLVTMTMLISGASAMTVIPAVLQILPRRWVDRWANQRWIGQREVEDKQTTDGRAVGNK